MAYRHSGHCRSLVWIVFGLNLFATISSSVGKTHLICGCLVLYRHLDYSDGASHVVKSMELPFAFVQKLSGVGAGVQDALVQWWYGHNAVAFFPYHPLSRI
jgi:cbb3-type cytochrome oxidase subunit 1